MRRIIAFILLLGSVTQVLALTEVCAACHNIDSNSTTPIWPKIAGLDEGYAMKQLLEFKKGAEGKRYDPSMYGIVQNLSEEELQKLANFYASQTMSPGKASPDNIELGEKLYRGGNLLTGVPACSACHSVDGAANYLAKFPRLAGQNKEYVVQQLQNFKTKQRTNDPNGMMQDISAKLSETEIQAVANYVAGLY